MNPDRSSPYRFWGRAKPSGPVQALAVPRVSPDAKSATVRIYGPIDPWGGLWGVSADEIAQALDELGDITQLQIRINSPGGSCFEGLAILNLLRAHPATVTVVVDGLAASAASLILAGADRRIMSPGTQAMVHDPWSSAFGCNVAELLKLAATLDSIGTGMAELYAEAAGGTAEEWRARMIDETWYTASEAVDAGLADEVAVSPDLGHASAGGDDGADESDGSDEPDEDEEPRENPEDDPEPATDDPEVEDRFDLSLFRYAGRAAAPSPTAPPSAAAVAAAAPLAQQPPNADVPAGMRLVDATLLEDGQRAQIELARLRRDNVINDAVRTGKIALSRREHWERMYANDPSYAASALAAIEPESAVPLTELGHSGGLDHQADDDNTAWEAFASQYGL